MMAHNAEARTQRDDMQQRTFGKYWLVKRLGVGGMGQVYLAKLAGPEGFEKLVVIKTVLEDRTEDPSFLRMFFAEARVAAQLQHPNIAHIYELGKIEDTHYIAMEYLRGKTLREILVRLKEADAHMHPVHVIEIISALCEGLSHAHNARDIHGRPMGLVHRDVSPHNVFVTYNGIAKVIDFGIAKSEMSSHKTETGMVKGKLAYLSPEQSRATDIDKRSDIYAAGICLYEALSGINPFQRANAVLTLQAVASGECAPVSTHDPAFAPFDAILNRAMSKDPSTRYGDCADMRDDLLELRHSKVLKSAPTRLSEFMAALFADDMATEAEELASDQIPMQQVQRMHHAAHLEHTPSGIMIVPPERVTQPEVDRAALLSAGATTGADRVKRRMSRFDWVLLAGSVFILIASLVGAWRLYLFLVQTVPVAEEIGSHPGDKIAQAPEPVADDGPRQPPPIDDAEPQDGKPQADTATDSSQDGGHDGGSSGRRRRSNKHRTSGKVPKKETGTNREVDKEAADKPPPGGAAANAPAPPGESPPAVKPRGVLAVVLVSSDPPQRCYLDGQPIGQMFRLRQERGTLKIGRGADAKTDPFAVSIVYSIEGKTVSYAIDANPWAIVKGNGIGLGRTPVTQTSRQSSFVLEFINPQEKRRQRISLKMKLKD